MCSPFELVSHPWMTQLEDWSFSSGHVPTANWVSLSCSEVYMDWSMRQLALFSSEMPWMSFRLRFFRRGNSFSILDSGFETLMLVSASSTFLMRCVRRAMDLVRVLESMVGLSLIWSLVLFIFAGGAVWQPQDWRPVFHANQVRLTSSAGMGNSTVCGGSEWRGHE